MVEGKGMWASAQRGGTQQDMCCGIYKGSVGHFNPSVPYLERGEGRPACCSSPEFMISSSRTSKYVGVCFVCRKCFDFTGSKA